MFTGRCDQPLGAGGSADSTGFKSVEAALEYTELKIWMVILQHF